jgi:hypothetical protein
MADNCNVVLAVVLLISCIVVTMMLKQQARL